MGQAHSSCCAQSCTKSHELPNDEPTFSDESADIKLSSSPSLDADSVVAHLSEGIGRPLQTDNLAGDFFTQILTIVWPHVAAVARTLADKQFSDTLQELKASGTDLAGVIKDMSLDFGTNPPEIRKLYSCRKISVSGGDGIEITCHLHWEAKANIELNVGRWNTGINGLSVDGLACIIFTPLVEEMPIVGGCHFFFCNLPKLDLNITGLANVVPKRMLKYALKSALRRIVVLPNRVTVRVGAAPIYDLPAWKAPRPIGVLRVNVLRARNIMKADWGWGHSDPYCVVSVGMSKHRTATRWDNEHPDWDETADLLVHHHRQLLRLKVFDEDKMKKDDPLGCILPEWTVARLIGEQSRLGGDGELQIPLETDHLDLKHLQPTTPPRCPTPTTPPRLLGRVACKGVNAAAPSESPERQGRRCRAPSEGSASGPSVVWLRVRYFGFPDEGRERASASASLRVESRQAVTRSSARTLSRVQLLSVKLEHMVGSQACLERAKGAVVSLAVGEAGDDASCKSARARRIPPTENYGCTVKDAETMMKLREMGLSPEDIVSALQRFDVDVVQKLTDPSHLSIGWNSTLHALVPDDAGSAALRICLEGKWFSLGEPFRPSGRGETRLRVINWPHGALEVKASIDAGHASPAKPDGVLGGFGAYDGCGALKPDEQWRVGTAPEQYANLKPGASEENLS